MAALQAAAALHRGLARAAALARGNGLFYAACGAITLLIALLQLDWIDVILGAIASAVGAAQVRAAARLRRAEPSAPGALARNELVLLGAIGAYCALELAGLGPSAADWEAQLDEAAGMELGLGELAESLATTTYATLLAVALLYQGGLALYFLRRRPLLERYVREAPAWARAVIEALHDGPSRSS
jgi:hypothetical protein